MTSDILRDIVFLLAGIGFAIWQYILAYRPELFERHLADWYKGEDFDDPKVAQKRHAQYRIGSVIGWLVCGVMILGALVDLVRIAFAS